MKTSFSEGKLMKQFGNPLFLRGFPLSTNPTISEQSFHDLLLGPNFKNIPPPPNFRGGEGANYENGSLAILFSN